MLYFVTGNKHKISSAKLHLSPFDIAFETTELPLIEIQSTSIEEIATQKAHDAFAILKQPLVIKDDGWLIHGLNGFPGPYMRYVNEWLTTEDFIHLLKDKENKDVTFYEVVCYKDARTLQLFTNKIPGKVLDKPQGSALPFMELCTFRNDRKSMAQCVNENISEFDHPAIWGKFGEWYQTTTKKSM